MPISKTQAARMLACLLAGAAPALAQELELPPGPETAAAPSALGPTQYDRNQSRLFGTRVAATGTPFQWGPFSLSPNLSYQYSYGNGLQATPGQSSTTATQTVSSGLLLGLGSVWSVDYTPTWKFYSNPAFHDAVNQQAAIQGGTAYDDWTLGFNQGYARTSDPLIETGRQTLDQEYTTGFNASYLGGSQVRIDLALDQDMRFSPGSPGTYQWTSPDWLHYQVSPQFDTAIGPEVGYTIEVPGGDMAYVKPQAQVTWRATSQMDLNLQGGVEHEEFLTTGGGSINAPTFGATYDYRPWETTTLTAGGSRGISPSLTADQLSESTQFTLGVQQRLLRYFYLGATAERQKVDYISTGQVLSTVRGDNLTSLQFSLTTTLFRRCAVAIQYSRTKNSSTATGFGFSSYQYGFSIGYKY